MDFDAAGRGRMAVVNFFWRWLAWKAVEKVIQHQGDRVKRGK